MIERPPHDLAVELRPATVDDAAVLATIHVAAWRHAYRAVMPAEFLDGLDERTIADRWVDELARHDPGTAAATTPAPSTPAPPAPTPTAAPAPAPATWLAIADGAVHAMTTVGPARGAARDAGQGDPTGELWMLNAHPAHHGSGAATALHGHALDLLRAQGHEQALLWVVDDNPRARRFYEREGWRADGVSKTDRIGGAEVAEVRYVIDL